MFTPPYVSPHPYPRLATDTLLADFRIFWPALWLGEARIVLLDDPGGGIPVFSSVTPNRDN
jgi:hypothetical protein